jgi:hypothetical protein
VGQRIPRDRRRVHQTLAAHKHANIRIMRTIRPQPWKGSFGSIFTRMPARRMAVAAIAVFKATRYIHVGTEDSPRNGSTECQT